MALPTQTTSSRRPTIRDVAAQSGVSRATVSYVLNNTPNQSIPEETRRRILEAAAALGYVPSAAAVALRRGHSNIVLVLKDATLSGHVTEPFLAAISERLQEAGHTALTTDYTTADALSTLVRELRPFGVVALAPVSVEEIRALENLGVKRTYHSFAGTGVGGDLGARPWEEEIGGRQAGHLLDSGAQRLLYALPEQGSPREDVARARALGAERVLRERSGEDLVRIRIPADRVEASVVVAELTDEAGPVGLCCFDDSVAGSALAGALDAGVGVPGSLMIIGVDDSPFASLMTPSLSSVRVDAHANGRAVADRLLGVGTRAGEEGGGIVAAGGGFRVVARESSRGQ